MTLVTTPTPAPPTDQTGPLDAGHTTSEFSISRAVILLSSIIAVLGTLTDIVSKVTAFVPESAKGLGMWLAVGSLVVGGLTSVAYTVQRGLVKIAAIKAGSAPPAVGSSDPTPDAAAAKIGG